MKRGAPTALVVAVGVMLAAAGTAVGAFQVVQMSATSGEPGDEVTIRVDASQMIGGSEQIDLFLVSQDAYEAGPEPARCDERSGATVAGTLVWQAAPVEFEGNTYPGFTGTGSITIPELPMGVYVVSAVLHNAYTGCHRFGLLAIGMELPDGAMASARSLIGVVALVGLMLLGTGLILAGRAIAWSGR